MNCKFKVSVIIPIYNAATYIEKCVETLMHQTLTDVEYIFINDASTDCSLQKLKSLLCHYPDKHTSIINLRENKGIANARNTGIKIAHGEYIIHCDSDDWVEPNAYSVLYQLAKESNSDIAACNFVNEYENNSSYYHQNYSTNMEDNMKRLLNGEIFPSLWSSMIKRELIVNNSICFPDNLNMGEDLLFNVKAYSYANRIIYTESFLYHYRHSENSVCVRRSWESIRSDITIAGLIEEFLKERNLYHIYEQEIMYRKFFSKIALVRNFDNINNYKIWLRVYPETNREILSYKKIEPKLRYMLWLASKHLYSISVIIKKMLYIQHTIRQTIMH